MDREEVYILCGTVEGGTSSNEDGRVYEECEEEEREKKLEN